MNHAGILGTHPWARSPEPGWVRTQQLVEERSRLRMYGVERAHQQHGPFVVGTDAHGDESSIDMMVLKAVDQANGDPAPAGRPAVLKFVTSPTVS